MAVAAVDAFPVAGRMRQGAYGEAYGCFVRIRTDDGLVGYGETDSCPSIIRAIIDAPFHHENMSGLRHLLLGADERDPARLRERLERGTICCGRGGPMAHAMAAVDLAIWDILGRRAGQPVHALLGTRKRDRVRAYATHPLSRDLGETAEHAHRLVAEGFTAIKFGWRPFGEDARQDEAIVRTLREAIGPQTDLLIDCGNAFDLSQALDRIERLEPYGLYWLEEPLDPRDLEGYARLMQARPPMRIAAGELCSTIEELRALVEQGRLEVVQVDISRVGITQALEFVRFAEPRSVRCVNHTYTLDLALAASLHLAAVLDDPLLLEYPAAPNDLRGLFNPGVVVTQGFIEIPTEPGLGVRVDETALQSAALSAERLPT